MNELKNVSTFFNELRLSAGAIWIENGKIKLSAPKKFQNKETNDFIINNKNQIITSLSENNILSDKSFLNIKILRDTTQSYYPLSPAQERLWFIEQYEEGTNAYNIPVAYELAANTEKEGVKYALQQIICRHEILRSTIEQVDNLGHGIQNVHLEPLSIEDITMSDTEDYNALIREDINRPFNLSIEYPIRVKFYNIQLSGIVDEASLNKILLLINIHHIATDGWSMDLFQKELLTYYEAYSKRDFTFSLPALKIQYKDYALWQKVYLTGDTLGKQLNYWKNKLSGYKTLELPTDYIRPDRTDYRGSYIEFKLDIKISQKLRSLAQSYGVTLYSVMLSSINILLSRYTGQDDIVVGSDIANRHHMQTEGLIGFFVNTQVNRAILNRSQSFRDLIQQVHQDQMEAQLYQDLPFEKLVDELDVERDVSRHPIFQVLFGMQSFIHQSKTSNKEKVYLKPYYAVAEVEPFDMSIYINDSEEELEGIISYATSIFNKNTITRLSDHYVYLLNLLTEAPVKPFSELSLLQPGEYDKLINEWNATDKEYPKDRTIKELFEEQVKKSPDAIAVVYEGQELSYRELNEKSNQLARHIRSQYKEKTKRSLEADTLIALCLERSLEMVIGILGVLKAGGAYVPIDPSYPQERIDYILEDTGTELILIKKEIREGTAKLPEDKVLYIDLRDPLYNTKDKSNLKQGGKAGDLAYVIYTSGSTGKPKGAMIEHAGMINHLYAKINLLHLNEKSIVAQNASQSFDISVWQFLAALISGGRVMIYVGDLILNPAQFISRLEEDATTILEVVPSYLSAMLDVLEKNKGGNLRSINYLLVTGEELKAELVKRWFSVFPKKYLVNAYGPTEASDDITHHIMTEYDNSKFIPIGKPVQNLKIYIVNNFMQLCPIGVIGEVCVSGIGVGRGYMNNALKTKEAFMHDPFSKEKGIRLYKTGDIGKWLADGTIQYIGRKDEQVKIRGYRIELGEIEHALLQIEGIRQACVLVKERKTETSSTKYLVGYYVLNNTDGIPVQSVILEQLSKVLPEYMVPAALVSMESFPLTINGKLDKQALPDPEFSSSAEGYVAPSNELESMLCKIWQEVLSLERIGITDNFFRIGGDSILSIQVSSRIRQSGYSCQVKDIFEYKTIAKLAEHLSKKSSEVIIKTEQGVLSGEFDLLPIQELFVSEVNNGEFAKPNHYNQSFLVKVPALDTKKLESIIGELISYHDITRIRYTKGSGKTQWRQSYKASITLPELKTLDISKYKEGEVHKILTEWQSSFDLEAGPLFQAGYLYGYKDGSARIFFALHHMIIDAVSWRILTDDIKALYSGKSLPEKGSSYRQWVSSVRGYVEQHPSEATYWEEQLKGMPHYESSECRNASNMMLFELDKDLTKSLLQESSKAYHTEVNDLLLTALAYALKEINQNDIQGITLEGHGREDIDPSIDHSHTVGWFTTMFPVKLEVRKSLKASIQSIKESLRSIPNKGIGFGAFASSRETKYNVNDLPPICFNYLGQFDNLQGDWQVAPEDSGNSIHSSNTDRNLININGMVSKGKLEFSIVTRLGEDVTKQLGDSFKRELVNVINHCTEKLENKESSYTPSDFKSVRISQSLLDQLQLKAKNI